MSEETFDLNEFLERVQDDKELLLELVDIFKADFKDKRVKLQAAVEQSNFEEIKSIAHSLKGASGNISAKALRETLLELEQKGKNNDLSNIEETLKNLDLKFDQLVERMDKLPQELG